MPAKQNLYFIAVIPPQKICEEITHFKNDFANRFQSKAALKVIPHITLKAPFRFSAEVHEHVIAWFKQMPVTVSFFQQELKDFGVFNSRHKPVIYVEPIMNWSLFHLQKQVLQNFLTTYPAVAPMNHEFEFKPHITIAYRDLKPHFFKAAWNEYQAKRYTAAFEINSFQLLEHNERGWNIISTFFLPALFTEKFDT